MQLSDKSECRNWGGGANGFAAPFFITGTRSELGTEVCRGKTSSNQHEPDHALLSGTSVTDDLNGVCLSRLGYLRC